MKNLLRALALLSPLALAACGGLEPGGYDPVETRTRFHEDPAVVPDPFVPDLPEPESPAQAFIRLLMPRRQNALLGQGISPLGSSPEPVPGHENPDGSGGADKGGTGGGVGGGLGPPSFKP